ncbi:MAG: hypothetical protein AAF502_19555 [Bacteroidota bacterium]
MSNTSENSAAVAALLSTPLIKPSLVSSAYGPLKHILYSYPKYNPEVTVYKRVFRDLIQKLPKYTKLSIWVHEDERIKKDLEQILKDETVSYAYASDRASFLGRGVAEPKVMLLTGVVREFSVWAQDPFQVVNDLNKRENGVHLVQPERFFDIGDGDKFATDLSDFDGINTHKTPISFHGGNTLTGDDFFFIGKADFRQTMNKLKQEHNLELEDAVKLTFEAYKKHLDSDRKMILISSEKYNEFGDLIYDPYQQSRKSLHQKKGFDQPIEHIDLYVSIAGKDDDGKQVVLVANPVSLEPVDEFTARALASQYTKTAANLEELGFKVVRNPMPKVKGDDGTIFDYHAYYNNCLVQIDEEHGKKVWLPQYGSDKFPALREYDQENQKIWKDLGFDPVPLTDFNDLSSQFGAVHCISKDLER